MKLVSPAWANKVMGRKKPWLFYAMVTTIFWGVWGALTGLPAENGFPDTLVYCVWAITMIIPTIFILWRNNCKIQTDKNSIFNGLVIGLLGAGGQMILFYSVTIGPTYLIFPIISLSPIITIVLSIFLLKERTGLIGIIGVIMALFALPLFEYSGDLVQVVDTKATLWFFIGNPCSNGHGGYRPTS